MRKRWRIFLIFEVMFLVSVLTAGIAQQPAGSRTKLILLGTGTPNSEPDKSGPAVAVVVDTVAYLVDCGPGVVRRAVQAYQEKKIEALKPSRLRLVFITHLHSDHTLGYPDLILSPWVLDRSVPLEAYGPPGLRNMTEHLLKAYQQDIYVRLFGLQPISREGYRVRVHEIREGTVYRDDAVEVQAFEVQHGSWPYAFGYKFITPDRVIVISGDTAPCEKLVRFAKGCDILVHEVYSAAKFRQRPAKWQRYHSANHTSAEQLGKLAERIAPGLLVLYHQLYWGASDEELVREVKRHFSGSVVSGQDLQIF
jgi:ribonuclease BN (tRNA processing enzyme)